MMRTGYGLALGAALAAIAAIICGAAAPARSEERLRVHHGRGDAGNHAARVFRRARHRRRVARSWRRFQRRLWHKRHRRRAARRVARVVIYRSIPSGPTCHGRIVAYGARGGTRRRAELKATQTWAHNVSVVHGLRYADIAHALVRNMECNLVPRQGALSALVKGASADSLYDHICILTAAPCRPVPGAR